MEFFSNVRFKFVAPAEDMPTMPGCDMTYLPPCFIVAVTVSEVAVLVLFTNSFGFWSMSVLTS